MEVRVLLPQPFGAWDCARVVVSPWQGEFQAGATPAGSTTFRVASFNSEAAGSYPAELGALPRRPTSFAAAERQHKLPLGSMAQQAAQLPHKETVAGANPARAPKFFEAWQSSNCSAL